MVEKFGTADYVPNGVSNDEFEAQFSALMAVSSKQKRGGVGGKGSKSHNFLESKNANRRRNEKNEREEAKAEEEAKQKWIEAENKKYAPVDKHDIRNMRKLAEKNAKLLKKMEPKPTDDDE